MTGKVKEKWPYALVITHDGNDYVHHLKGPPTITVNWAPGTIDDVRTGDNVQWSGERGFVRTLNVIR